ncbi:hypothetical protein [Rheinheimera faecalis]|uniref:hypothetical protein n=1 Tax=Rheinheimera faecalis TaxID=2901141 RepID=UPI001E3C9FD2|nr:hypothetical protein [Rheinheimera faecalis]
MKNFGFILFPGMRSWAYLQVLHKLQLDPALIIVMQNTKRPKLATDIDAEWVTQSFFNPDYHLEHYLSEHKVKVQMINSESINDTELLQQLNKSGIKRWLFSGGGIIKKHLFEHGHKFLHVHPGQLPQVKGSTCFYYSLLCDQSLAASSFWMTPELDAGEALHISHFKVNLPKERLSPGFVDQILDPWIRARCLYNTLKPGIRPTSEQQLPVQAPSSRPCYVMHPVLRALALRKTIGSFDKDKEIGIIEL